MSVLAKAKGAASTSLGLVLLVGLLCIPAFFILGAEWFAKKALPLLFILCWIALAIDILMLLGSVIRSARPFTGAVIGLSSFLFGITSWLFSMVITQELWGTWAVVLGLLMLGGAVVPFALLASAFKGAWLLAGTVVALFAITWIARAGGAAIELSGRVEGQ